MPRTTRKQRNQSQKSSHKKASISQKQLETKPVSDGVEGRPGEYKSFKLSKRIKHPGPKLSNSFKLTRTAFAHVWRYKRLFAIISLAYLALNLLFVRGFVFTADITLVKEAVSELFSGSVGQIAGSVTVAGLLATSLNPQTEVAALYQTILVILFSLFMIWTLRQTYVGDVPKIKDVFYRSSYPLIPFVIIVFIIGLQLMPLILASFLYNAVIVSNIAVSFTEVFAVGAVIFLLVLWSLYMITASVFALYVVALPDMTPRKALRSARGLVQHRRWTVMRRVLFLPLALTVIGFVGMIPVIIVVPVAAEVIFLVATAFILPLAHSYLYSLYRELLA